MRLNRIKLWLLLLNWGGLLISIFVFFMSSEKNGYELLGLLPLSFSVLMLMFFNSFKEAVWENIGAVLIILQLFIRNVIAPFLIVIGDYATIFPPSVAEHITKAIALMIYEMITVFITIYLASRMRRVRYLSIVNRRRLSNKRLGFVVFFVALLCVILWLVFPSISKSYRSIVDIVLTGEKNMSYSHFDVMNAGSVERIGNTLFVFCFSFARLIVPAYIIVNLASRNRKSVLGFIVSLLLAAAQFLFIPDAVASALFSALILLVLIMRMYSKYTKFLVSSMIVLGSCITIITFIGNVGDMYIWYGFNFGGYLSNWIDNYFTGVVNVANTYNLVFSDRFDTLIGTVVQALPFNSVLFPFAGDWRSIDMLYTALPRSGGQIVSTIGSGAFFFTSLFAPVFSCMFTVIAVKYGERYNKSQNPWKYIAYLYLAINAALGLGMYNVPITLIHIIQAGVPLLIISAFAGDDMYSRE